MGFQLTTYGLVVAIVGTVVPIALSALVARFGRRRDLVLPFVVLNAAIAGWNLDFVALGALADEGTAIVVDRVAQACILAIPWCWTVFAAAFVDRPLSPLVKRLSAAFLATLFLLAWTPWYFSGYRRLPFGFYGVAGPVYPLVVLSFVAAYVCAAWLLFDGVRRVADRRLRHQRLHVLAASLLMGLLGSDNFLPVFGAVHRPFGQFAVIAYSAILALALVRFRLMDFTVVFRRGLAYSVLTALASLGFLTLALVGSEMTGRGGGPPRLLPVVAGLAVAAGAYPALRWLEGKFLRSLGGRILDRRRLLRECRERWQSAPDPALLEDLFRVTMASIFPGVEANVRWGERPAIEEVVAGAGRDRVSVPGGECGTWCVPLRSGNRVAGVVVLSGCDGWSMEELDLAADLIGQFASTYRDLSHRIHVRGIEEFHRRVLDTIDIGLLLLDGRGAVVAANGAGRLLLGDMGWGQRSIDTALLDGPEPFVCADGREVRIRVTAIPSERLRDLRVVALEDISGQRELERRAQLADTVSALGRMGAMVAHEIRTPLSTIMGACTLLRAQQPRDGESAEYIGIILDEVGRVERFVDNCLRATRDPDPVLDPVTFDPLVAEIVSGCPAGEQGLYRLRSAPVRRWCGRMRT